MYKASPSLKGGESFTRKAAFGTQTCMWKPKGLAFATQGGYWFPWLLLSSVPHGRGEVMGPRGGGAWEVWSSNSHVDTLHCKKAV